MPFLVRSSHIELVTCASDVCCTVSMSSQANLELVSNYACGTPQSGFRTHTQEPKTKVNTLIQRYPTPEMMQAGQRMFTTSVLVA